MRRAGRFAAGLALALFAAQDVLAGSIDTALLESAWEGQHEREYEVGRHAVNWRERGSKQEGVFAGMRFAVPLGRERTWFLANEYEDVGTRTPGIKSVTVLEDAPGRQVIAVEAEVLWYTLRLKFEIEEEKPDVVRFRLSNPEIGQYSGFCRFRDLPADKQGRPQTEMEFATWLKPSRPVPVGLVLLAQRMVLLRGARSFLKTCESPPTATPHS